MAGALLISSTVLFNKVFLKCCNSSIIMLEATAPSLDMLRGKCWDWPALSTVPSGPLAQGSTGRASQSSRSGSPLRPSTAPGTDPGGPGCRQRRGFLCPRSAGTGSSDIPTWGPRSWGTPAWPLLWKSWRRQSPHTSGGLREAPTLALAWFVRAWQALSAVGRNRTLFAAYIDLSHQIKANSLYVSIRTC